MCLACETGFYLNEEDNSCRQCSGSCLECKNSETCDRCEGELDWAFRTEDGQCECLYGWSSDPSTPFKCMCERDFVKQDGNCVNCNQLIDGCLQCKEGVDKGGQPVRIDSFKRDLL